MAEYPSNVHVLSPKPEEKKTSFHKKRMDYKSTSSNVKECLTKYTLEDRVEALKKMFAYNETRSKDPPWNKHVVFETKKRVGVKECLQAGEKTPFQTIISELKNTVVNSYWNKEVGKTRYQVAYLPVGMNPLETTFGKKIDSDGTVGELINPKTPEDNETIRQMYRLSHNNFEPAEQINREYDKPFDKYFCFGKRSYTNFEGARTKRALGWVHSDPVTIVNSIQAEFKERNQPRVGEVKNPKDAQAFMYITHGKSEEKEVDGVVKALSDIPISREAMLQKTYLQHVNVLRQRYKKRFPEIPFYDVYSELQCLDRNYTDFLPEDKVLEVLAEYQIHVDKSLFLPLLDILKLREQGKVKYTEAVNLLNWKYDFPILPKIQDTSVDCENYNTTYKETMGVKEQIDVTNIPTAGLTSKELNVPVFADKECLEDISAYSLIFPSVFTRYGLSNSDLFKLRSKEEIKSIFEDIGVEFPDNTFDMLWEKGLKKDGKKGVSVETFRHLLDEHELLALRSK